MSSSTIHTVTVHEAKTNLSKLIAEVLAGGEVVIARGKVPAVKLVPVESASKAVRRVPGRLKGLIAIDERFFEPLPEEELARWNGEAD
jgi:prevent-host-death family protein